MILYLLLIIYCLFLFLRLLRSLAILQQKEYRFDRVWLFLKSREGQFEICNLLPIPYKLTDIKRPIRTLKISVLFYLSFAFLGWLILISFEYNSSMLKIFLILFALYILLPIIIFFLTLPNLVISEIISNLLLKKAKDKLSSQKPLIIGITGSYGKTSTKLLLAYILSKKYSVFTTPKSYNTKLAIARSINNQYQGQEIVILEYAAYTKGEIKTLASYFKPQIAVITGITSQHLGLFGSTKEIVKAKSELLEALPKNGLIFYNSMDKQVVKMVGLFNQTKIKFGNPEDITDIQLDEMGRLKFKFLKRSVKTNIIGRHYLTAIDAGIKIALELILKPAEIIQRIADFRPGDNFIKAYQNKNGPVIIDDGKTSNFMGYKAAIRLASQLNYQPKILLTSGIIDLGNHSNEVHQKLADRAYKVFNRVLYSDSEGRIEFKNKFKENLLDKESEIINELKNLPEGSLLLIEGKIKPHLLNVIDAYDPNL